MIGMSFANSYALAQGCDMDNRVHSESRMVCLGMLKKMTLEHIKELMKSGDVKVAAAELQKLLAAEPDNAEAKMLYGTCCHLLGDDKTFAEIHDELAPKMEGEKDEQTLSLWRKYRAIWLALIGTGLILAGGAYLFGRDIGYMFAAPVVSDEPAMQQEDKWRDKRRTDNLYAGHGYYKLRKEDFLKFEDAQ